MNSNTSLLTLCRKALAIESSHIVGNKKLGGFITQNFTDFKWNEIPVHGDNSLFYIETQPEKEEIDILCY